MKISRVILELSFTESRCSEPKPPLKVHRKPRQRPIPAHFRNLRPPQVRGLQQHHRVVHADLRQQLAEINPFIRQSTAQRRLTDY